MAMLGSRRSDAEKLMRKARLTFAHDAAALAQLAMAYAL